MTVSDSMVKERWDDRRREIEGQRVNEKLQGHKLQMIGVLDIDSRVIKHHFKNRKVVKKN